MPPAPASAAQARMAAAVLSTQAAAEPMTAATAARAEEASAAPSDGSRALLFGAPNVSNAGIVSRPAVTAPRSALSGPALAAPSTPAHPEPVETATTTAARRLPFSFQPPPAPFPWASTPPSTLTRSAPTTISQYTRSSPRAIPLSTARKHTDAFAAEMMKPLLWADPLRSTGAAAASAEARAATIGGAFGGQEGTGAEAEDGQWASPQERFARRQTALTANIDTPMTVGAPVPQRRGQAGWGVITGRIRDLLHSIEMLPQQLVDRQVRLR